MKHVYNKSGNFIDSYVYLTVLISTVFKHIVPSSQCIENILTSILNQTLFSRKQVASYFIHNMELHNRKYWGSIYQITKLHKL